MSNIHADLNHIKILLIDLVRGVADVCADINDNKYVKSVTEAIKSQLTEIEWERTKMLDEIERIKEETDGLVEEIYGEDGVDRAERVSLERTILCKMQYGEELEKYKKTKMEYEIKNGELNREIEKYGVILDGYTVENGSSMDKVDENNCNNPEISLIHTNKLLKSRLDSIKQKLQQNESYRTYFYTNIKMVSRDLKIDCPISYDETVQELDKLYNTLKNELETNKNEFIRIREEISAREELFGDTACCFDECYSRKYLKMMISHLEQVKQNEVTKIQEIKSTLLTEYHNELAEYQTNITKIGVPDHQLSNQTNIDELNQVNELIEFKSTLIKMKETNSKLSDISDLMGKRDGLLSAIDEFEKLAADPRRLFKSSFQLNKEEKFRKTAIPTLIKIETEITKMASSPDLDPSISSAISHLIQHNQINRKLFKWY
ncbi:hypothetical protein ECANGB1_1895 [Enterospora canceri]|uniref:Uncharacterized protein n=1 Tax=Enterospora canceri TaxID=1081671 RepID=A0A1Y1S8Z0_9MICR|nr:hypothetical protein ECANGB1_1895 [Enterospora canceri]